MYTILEDFVLKFIVLWKELRLAGTVLVGKRSDTWSMMERTEPSSPGAWEKYKQKRYHHRQPPFPGLRYKIVFDRGKNTNTAWASRTPLSWLKITVFYLIYYTLLACFWIACLMIFFQVWKQTTKLKILQDQYNPHISRLCHLKLTDQSGSKIGGLLDRTQGWGLRHLGPPRALPSFLSHLANFQSTMITFQLGMRPQQRDSLIDSQMFVLKVFYFSQMFVMDVRFLADVCFWVADVFFCEALINLPIIAK